MCLEIPVEKEYFLNRLFSLFENFDEWSYIKIDGDVVWCSEESIQFLRLAHPGFLGNV